MANVIEDVTCAGCCCVCDNIQITTDGTQILNVQTTCSQGRSWFEQFGQTDPLLPLIDGRTVSHSDAVQQAVDLIHLSKAPLIWGMSQSSTDSNRAAVALADQIGATIDTAASSNVRALQQVGEASCTLGEVRSRADLIIYWGADALLTNHCHRETLLAGHEEFPRTIVSMGTKTPESSEDVDKSIQVEAQNTFEVIWYLRGLLKGIDFHEGESAGAYISDLKELVSLIQQSKYIVFFFGPEFKQGHLSHRDIEALSILVREIQADRRCHTISVPPASDTKGVEHVLAWQTGYAANVNFAAGYPRYFPIEFSASQLIQRGEIDLCVLVGAQPLSGLSKEAQKYLTEVPTILVGPAKVDDLDLNVYIPTGVYGIHFPGSIYRIDGTPLPLRGLVSTNLLSEADVLTDITSFLKQTPV
ncbi:hypothetical protein [Gimesia aquarii]|uniref:Formyltransferase/hydrolase complex Fhc subunit B n=1 Tax=Gimesia aquarii TaxID=2527964 RepID=A0A517VX99_9PLAN|nr:hypothetical protein [Gimesia aquarii]QDT97625.1 Formyltransferase/hydrolase complex Fhc subunit B [Gimesia aquarii]